LTSGLMANRWRSPSSSVMCSMVGRGMVSIGASYLE
jgi:hypothetical protein